MSTPKRSIDLGRKIDFGKRLDFGRKIDPGKRDRLSKMGIYI